MNKKIFHYLEMAAKIAKKNGMEKNFLLGSVGIRSDGVLVSAFNLPTKLPSRLAHSEYRLSSKLDYGATIYVARVRCDTGKFGMAKPCHDCFKALKSKKFKKIYYTISQNEYGIIYPEN